MMMYVSLEHDSINFNAQCVDLKKKKKCFYETEIDEVS